MRTAALLLAATSLLTGCAGFMSGLDGETSFSCKAPPGVSCQSISGTYSNSIQNNLPSQRKQGEGESVSESDGPKVYGDQGTERVKLSPRDMEAMTSGIPVRQPPLIVRVWVAPWEDEAGDLHDQSYFYTMIHSGKWVIEANRTAISNRFRPVYPLNRGSIEAPSKPEQPEPRKSDYSNLVEKPNQDNFRTPE